jgi:hypothetical protein
MDLHVKSNANACCHICVVRKRTEDESSDTVRTLLFSVELTREEIIVN